MSVFFLWQILHGHLLFRPDYKLTPLPDTVVAIPTQTATTAHQTPSHPPVSTGPLQDQPIKPPTYIEITSGCSISLSDTCVRAYAAPSSSSTERTKLRIGSVLFVKNIVTAPDGTRWYQIDFPEALRYPERLTLPWYVPEAAGTLVKTDGPHELNDTASMTTKRLLIDRSDQLLYAFDGDTLVRTFTVSTGRELTPTPRGTFTVFRKTPSRYMQGPIPGISTNYYDLPGVPWNLYFTEQGAVVHGAYWHNGFGRPYSNGCVNVRPNEARELYEWAEIGMSVTVQD
jgi:lipoprotein-anchoring transpeptidase ErfK/SrfK